MSLFDVDPLTVPYEHQVMHGKSLSVDRRRTIRNNEAIRKGFHPVSGRALLGDGSTCGDCAHCCRVALGKTYVKCELFNTASVTTDIRKRWPACSLFEALLPTGRPVEGGE